MNRSLMMKLAVSGFVLGITTTGCSMNKMANAPSNALGNPATAAKSADEARAALEKGRANKAVSLAEAAVSASPLDANYRALLGQAYMNDGRFASAASALTEAMELGAHDSNTVLALILANLGQGKTNEALVLIAEHRDILPAPDMGLALALAGDTNSAIYVLTEAARAEGATARTRQNLALAFALDGRWAQARILAAQDLSLAKVEARMTEWSTLAAEQQQPLRVANLIGVTPKNDTGMPVRLALANFSDMRMAAAPEPVVLASVDPAPLESFAPPAPANSEASAIRTVELPMPQRDANGVVPVTELPSPAAAPVILAEADGFRHAPRAAGEAKPRPFPEEARALAAKFIPQIAAFDARKPSGWAVQLGAYDSLGVAKEKWGTLKQRNSQLAGLPASSYAATVRGRTFYRLTVNGIKTQADASRLCRELRADGQRCFIREMGGSETIQWAAAAKPVQLASR